MREDLIISTKTDRGQENEEVVCMKREEKLFNEFIALVEEESPEYALGVLESMKGAYFLKAWDKTKEGNQ